MDTGAHRVTINAALVRQLVVEQFPHWAHLPPAEETAPQHQG